MQIEVHVGKATQSLFLKTYLLKFNEMFSVFFLVSSEIKCQSGLKLVAE